MEGAARAALIYLKKDFKTNIKELASIYWTMFIIGLTTFGGGYAMVAIIQRELGEKKNWMTDDELLDYIALSQITPGVIAVNVSTFVGRKRKGVAGAIAATLGVVTPSIIIILIIAALLTNFADNEYVKHAFAGIRICVCALVVNATIKFLKQTVVDWLTLIIFICVFIVAAFTATGTVIIVLCVIALSVILTLVQAKHPFPALKTDGNNQSASAGGEKEKTNKSASAGGEKEKTNKSGSAGGEKEKTNKSGSAGGEKEETNKSGSAGGEKEKTNQSGSAGGEKEETNKSASAGGEKEETNKSASAGGEKEETNKSGSADGERERTNQTGVIDDKAEKNKTPTRENMYGSQQADAVRENKNPRALDGGMNETGRPEAYTDKNDDKGREEKR